MVPKDLVRTRLQQYHTNSDDMYRDHPLGTAAVLVPLLYKDGALHVLLTVRSREVRSHKGEVCFPGGKTDPEDKDSIHTALREAEEEIKLHPEDVDVLSQTVPVTARDGILVTPVVGFIPDSFQPTPNNEVTDVFTMPLENFLSSEGHSSRDITWKGNSAQVHYFQYKEKDKTYITFGFTALIAMIVAAQIYERTPEFDTNKSIALYIENLRDARSRTFSNSSKM
ncbi:peroxisomal coenzyme A diphosphatase NUDT7-like [Branchiostoma floridae x Branchiostoma belcheri]